MPVFDFFAVARILIRITFILGLIAFVLGLTNVLGDAILLLWGVVSDGVDSLNGSLNNFGAGGGFGSCLAYYISVLGIDVAVSSFLLSLSGLAMTWASLVVTILTARVGLSAKNTLLRLTA